MQMNVDDLNDERSSSVDLNSLIVGYGQSVSEPEKLESIPFYYLYKRIKTDPELKAKIEKLRTITDQGEQTKFKENNLPYFNMGLFGGRRCNENLIKIKHLLFDVDNLKSEEVLLIKAELKSIPEIFCIFVSPRGRGLKFICEIDNSIRSSLEYEPLYKHYAELFGAIIGHNLDHTIDAQRPCFMSYDPDIYLNVSHRVLPKRIPQEQPALLISNNGKMRKDDFRLVPGAAEFLRGSINDYYEWIRIGMALSTIGMALSTVGEAGREYWHIISDNDNYNDSSEYLDKKYDNFLKTKKSITIATFFYIAREYGYQYPHHLPENVKKEIEPPESQDNDLFKLLEQTSEIIKIYPAQDFKDETLWYSSETSKGTILLNSKQNHFFLENLPEKLKVISKPTTLNLKPSTVLKFLKDENSSTNYLALDLYQKIKSYLERYIFFKNCNHSNLLSVWILGTYIFTVFRHYPYLQIRAEKRSGKTLLMEVMKYISFNGELLTNITEAGLFREIDANRTVLFWDEAERLRKQDKELYGTMLSILNSGFKFDGLVKRVEKRGSVFKIFNYSTYSPKVFSGINDIDDVLQDRTILIQLLRKKPSENVKRLKISKSLENEIDFIKQSGYLFGLRYGKRINESYQNCNLIAGLPEELTDREKDIWEPLFIIASLIEEEAELKGKNIDLLNSLIDFARDSAEGRVEEDIEQNLTGKTLNMFCEIVECLEPKNSNDTGKYYSRNDIWEIFNQNHKELFPYTDTKTKFVRLIRKTLNLKPLQYLHNTKDKEYFIQNGLLEDLKERFIGENKSEIVKHECLT
jgi:hypothetical protein